MLVGYIRVSSDSDRQTTDLQRDALLSAGVDSRHLTNLAAGDTSVGSTPKSGIRLISRPAEASARPGPPSPGCWRVPFVVNSHGVMSRFGAGTHEPRHESGRPPRPPVQMRHIAHPPSGNSSGLGVSSP